MSRVFYEELLSKFKRSNKDRKLKIATQSGFDTTEQYIDFLESNINGTNTLTEGVAVDSTPTIVVIDVVDRSGSMNGSKLAAANRGVREGLAELKKDPNANYLYGLIDFGSDVEFTDISELTSKTNVRTIHSNGMTALHDAVGMAVQHSVKHADPNMKILINVYTDGGENFSRNYTRMGKAKRKGGLSITELIEKYSDQVTITFIGTELDVLTTKALYGLKEGNTLVYDGSAEGLSKTLSKTQIARKTYSAKVKAGEDVSDGFYKDVN